jgi:hypothetical protein
MSSQQREDPTFFEKLKELPPKKLAEVEDFVDFLRHKDVDRRLRQAAMKLSEGEFENAFNNPAAAASDEL